MGTRTGIGFIFLLVAGAALVGCAASQQSHYQPIERALTQNEFDEPLEMLLSAYDEGAYSSRDRVLFWMEKGIAHHYAGNHERSNELLTRADHAIDDLYTVRISEVGEMLLTSENAIPYEGAPHEQLYINVYKALNYLQLNDPRSAAVEARKLDNKLVHLEHRYRRDIDRYPSLAQSELDLPAELRAQTNPSSTEFHTSALSRYIGYMVHMHEARPDSLRIDHQEMRTAFSSQPHLYPFEFPDLPDSIEPIGGDVPVHFVAMLGKGPVKQTESFRLHLPESEFYVTMEFPVMRTRPSQVKRVEVVNDEGPVTTLRPLEDVNRIARHSFELERPVVVNRTVLRALVRAFGLRELQKEIDEDSRALRDIAHIGGIILQEVLEQADVRSVRLLPGEFHVSTTTLAPGQHDVRIHYYGSGDRLLGTEQKTITVTDGELHLVRLVNFS